MTVKDIMVGFALKGTTAEEQNLSVNHSKMLILWGPPERL